MVDFTNPDAKEWFKNIVKENLVKGARASGWMNDFGEYSPFDAVPFSGEDMVTYHNRYPLMHSQATMEALDEMGEEAKDVFFFMRAGSTTSP